MPVYNIEYKKQVFVKAVNSILKQTYSDFEVILVNDGSIDSTQMIINHLVNKDRRIRTITKENGGVESARRVGISEARGDFIMHIDQDDLYVPYAFELFINAAKSSKADCVIANHRRFFVNKALVFGGNRPPSLYAKRLINHDTFMNDYYISFFGINDLPVNIWNKMYKKSFIDDIPDPPLTHCIIEDLSYNMHILPYAERLALLPDVTYLYRWGGWTNHYDPTILNTALVGYKLKTGLIEQYSLPFKKTSSVELINYLNTYFYSLLEYKKVSELSFKDEVKRVLELPEVKEACKVVNKGMDRFPHMEPIIKGDIDTLYEINCASLKKNRAKNAIKRIALFFSN